MAEERFVKTVNGIFLGNVYDPLELKVEWPDAYCDKGENEFDSRSRMVKWMSTKTIGPPVATPEFEESDLRSMGFIGVYFNEKNGDTYCSAEVVSATFPGGRTDVDYLGQAVWENYKRRHHD